MEHGKEKSDHIIDNFIGVDSIAVASKNFVRLFGAEVKTRRIAVGLRQEELAEIAQSYGIQVSQSYISRLESGQRSDPDIALIVVLTTLLNISLDHIVLLARSDPHAASED
jgi:transcriptional regulator with XRE-family HTH domain